MWYSFYRHFLKVELLILQEVFDEDKKTTHLRAGIQGGSAKTCNRVQNPHIILNKT